MFFYNYDDISGGASKASDKCSFAKISGNNKDWCNGRGKPAPLRKARGIVRKISLMVRIGSNPYGSRPSFFGRRHLTFDKGRAWMLEVERPEFRKDAKLWAFIKGHGCPKLNAQSFAGMRNRQSVHMARMRRKAMDSTDAKQAETGFRLVYMLSSA